MRIVGRPDEILGTHLLDDRRGQRLVRVGRDQTLAVEILARLERGGNVLAHHLVFVVHAVEPRRNPVGARLQDRALEARIFLEHAPRDHLGERGHHVNGEKRKPEQAVALVVVEPVRERRLVAHHDVEPDRHGEVLHGRPEPLEFRVVEMFVPARRHVGRQVHADAAVLPGAGDLFRGPFGIEQRDVGDRLQPCRVFAGEVGDPAIVGARIGGRQFRVLHRTFPTDAQRGVEHGDVDALVVHHLEARPRVVAALRTAIRVRQLAVLLQRDRVHPDSAQHAHVSAHEFQRAVVDQQHLVVVFVTVDANGPVAVRGVDIAEPQVRGFHHVAVGIDHRTLRQLRGAVAHAVLPLLHFHTGFPASLLRPDARFKRRSFRLYQRHSHGTRGAESVLASDIFQERVPTRWYA